jgi:hypothetical protein
VFPEWTFTRNFRNVASCDLYNLSTVRNTPKREVAKGPTIPTNDFIDDRLHICLRGVPREQKMLKGHLPGVIYHGVYLVDEDKPNSQKGGDKRSPGSA